MKFMDHKVGKKLVCDVNAVKIKNEKFDSGSNEMHHSQCCVGLQK